MPKDNSSNEISPSQFVNVIKSLIKGKYVYDYWRAGDSKTSYIQLPEAVSTNLTKLNLSLHSKKMKAYYNANNEFDSFVTSLVKYARANYWYPHSEKEHAQYLLGFLLHNNFQIRLNEHTLISMEDLVYDKLPSHESHYFKTGSYYKWQVVPDKTYDFLSPEWRALQQYPNMDTVAQHWQQIVSERNHRKTLKAQEKQKRDQEYQLRQQQYYWELQHRFNHIVLDFRLFSYALEGYISFMAKHEEHHMQEDSSPVASATLIALTSQFSHHARTMDPNHPQHQEIVAKMLDAFLYHLMNEAKYDHTAHGNYAKKLLGFLLYHNFQVSGFGKKHSMQDFFWNNSSDYEKFLLRLGNPQHLFFASSAWQQTQHYPDKQDLENTLSQKQLLQTQMSNQQNTFLRAYQPTAFQSSFVQQAPQNSLYQSTQPRSILGY